MDSAALYLRSSKDRHDVSPDAQRRELMDLAIAKSLTVVETFQDVEERADDEKRPGFQALLHRLKSRDRQWKYLLITDTARVARQHQHLAAVFSFECEKRGVKILYAKLPETNTIMDVVLKQVVQAFDMLHSLMSREKGLGGMAENVKQGWRAGGRAPFGYRLEHIPTGAMRDGAPVTKSRLVPNADAPKIAAYLKDRAAGISRRLTKETHQLTEMAESSLIGVEWNALTYAGHTVWNVNAERLPGGGYKGGTKRRPRSDWVIQYDTHQALITTEEAEAILAKVEAGRPTKYRTAGDYLLSGLLKTPEGKAWHGSGDGYYRSGKGKRIAQGELEAAIVSQVQQDLTSDAFVKDLLSEARRMSAPPPDAELKPLRDQVNALTATISRCASLAAQTESPRPFLEQINTLEKQREKLVDQLASKEAEQQAAEVFRAITEKDVRGLLAMTAQHLQEIDRDALKELLCGVLEGVELCPTNLTCRLHYKFATGELVASPRGFEPRFIP